MKGRKIDLKVWVLKVFKKHLKRWVFHGEKPVNKKYIKEREKEEEQKRRRKGKR